MFYSMVAGGGVVQVAEVGSRLALSVGVDLVPVYASAAAKAAVREAERAVLVAAGELPADAISRPGRLTEVLQVGVLDRVEVHELLDDIAVAQARLHALQAAVIDRLAELQPVQQALPGARGTRAGGDADGGDAGVAGGVDRPDDWVADEVACVLGIGVSSAAWLVDKQRVLHTQLPAVWAALADGDSDVRRAQVIVDALAHRKRSAGGGLADAVVDRVAAQGLAWIAEGVGPTPLADRVAGAVIAADPDEAQRRAGKRQRRQNVTTTGAGDGLAGFRADLLTAADAAAMQARVDAMAAVWRTGGDRRPIGVLRVESLKQLVLRPWEALPEGVAGAGWQLRLRADLADLDREGPLRANGQSTAEDPAPGPAADPTRDPGIAGLRADGRAGAGCGVGGQVTAGCGAVVGSAGSSPNPADGCGVGSVGGLAVPPVAVTELLARYQALQLTASSGGEVWFEIIDATGRLRAVASPEQARRATSRGAGLGPPPAVDGYTPSAGQVRFVRARDRHCRFPGCTRPAEYADLDHAVPHDHHNPAAGGSTCVTNLICLCRRHHRLKTHAPGWTFRMDDDGTLHVTLPTGTTRTTRPPGMAEAVITGTGTGTGSRAGAGVGTPGSTGSTSAGSTPAGGDPFTAMFGPTPKRYRTPTPDEKTARRTAVRERAELTAIIDAELDARLAAAAEGPPPF